MKWKENQTKMTVASIILAAGQGTRMRSRIPKVLHSLAGKPMVWHALKAVRGLVDQPPVLVVGHQADLIEKAVGSEVRFVLQEEQLGTGHAVAQAESLLMEKAETILVTFADMPLLKAESLEGLLDLHRKAGTPLTMTSFVGEEARGFGRVIRDEHGKVISIVEQVDATPEQLAIREYNVSAYCFEAGWLWEIIHQIPLSAKGEYYLTDAVALAVGEGHAVESLVLNDPAEAIGINDRVHLAEAEKILRQRINQQWMVEGVTIINPDLTYIDSEVKIGQDSIIRPNTYLRGETVVGESCDIGPDTTLIDTRVGNQVQLIASVLEQAELADRVSMGPFCHLRKGAVLDEGVHLGNFAEVKDAYLGPNTKMGHFSYIGNARIGKNVNIGAGTVTCNYDGINKNLTEIGDDVFLGSDTMLVAPLKIGARSVTGAGAVVTHDVPEDTLVHGVPAKIKRKLGDCD